MANTIYCDTCGSKNIYEAVKPKFCGSCSKGFGSSFGNAAAPRPAQRPTAARVNTYQPAAEEYEQYEEPVPRFKKPDSKKLVSISMFRNIKGGDLVNMDQSIERPIENSPLNNPDLEIKSRSNGDRLLSPIHGAKIQKPETTKE